MMECETTRIDGKIEGWSVCTDNKGRITKTFFVDGKESSPSQNRTPSLVQNRTLSLVDYKKQCAEIGFTPNTDKFADCVLRMMEMNSSSKPQTVIQNNTGSDPAVRALLEEQKRQRELDGALELMKRGNEMMQPPKPKLTCTYNPVLRQTTCN
jgi:hypothetical protein